MNLFVQSNQFYSRQLVLYFAGLCLMVISTLGYADIQPLSDKVSNCAGIANYADELVPSNYWVVHQTPLGDGIDEIEISVQLNNNNIGHFNDASLSLDLASLDLGIIMDPPPQPATFGEIQPNGDCNTCIQNNLTLRLPSSNVTNLIDQLNASTDLVTVHATEKTVLAENVTILRWSALEEAHYVNAEFIGVQVITPDPPYTPGQQFAFILVDDRDEVINVFDNYQDGVGSFYIVADETITVPPVPLRNARIVQVDKVEDPDPNKPTIWNVVVENTLNDNLPSLVTSGSFCTGESAHINPSIEASRLFTIDDEEQEEEERDSHVQPIRFNNIPFANGNIKVSGQIQGHVMKPSLELRLRNGIVRAVVDFDNDLSMTATIQAEHTFDPPPETVDLYDLCFPLPPLPVGPVEIPMNLVLKHTLSFDGRVTAGAVMGIQKNFKSNFTVGFDGSKDEGDRFFSEGINEHPDPFKFTPPRLTDDTQMSGKVQTDISVALRLGASYPFCDSGASAFVHSSGFVSLDVLPTQNPWWEMRHGAEAFTGIGIHLLGLNIANEESDPFFTLGDEILTSDQSSAVSDSSGSNILKQNTNLVPGALSSLSSGEDQRWSVAIDDIDVPNGYRNTAIAALSDGQVALISREKVTGNNYLMLFDRFGAFQWSIRYKNIKQPQDLLILPDDSIVVIGTSSWIAKHDISGNLLWDMEYDLSVSGIDNSNCEVESFTYIEDGAGEYGFIAAGTMGVGSVKEADACAFRAGHNGDLVWAKHYSDSGLQGFLDVSVTSDGNIVFAGTTEKGVDATSENNGLVLKTDANGEPIWAKSFPLIFRGGNFNAVAEGQDGVLFMVGEAGGPLNSSGAAMVASIDSDGNNAHHAFLFQDETWEQTLDFKTYTDTAGGDTPYDEFFDIKAVSGGMIIVGTTGLIPEQAAWVIEINSRLGTEWFLTIDGAEAELLDSISVTEDGVFVSGWSESFANFQAINSDERHIWLSKLPFEGKITLLEETQISSRFLEPGIRNPSNDTTLVPGGIVTIDAPLVVTDALVNSVTSIPDLLASPANICATLLTESGHVSTLDSCEDELDSDSDGIADDLDNCLEKVNPNQRDTNSDGYGNICDPDFNNDGSVNRIDFNTLRSQFGLSEGDLGYDTNIDLNGDNAIGLPDFNIFRTFFGKSPGPSGLSCAGTIPCTAP